jgi:hypothetical protein
MPAPRLASFVMAGPVTAQGDWAKGAIPPLDGLPDAHISEITNAVLAGLVPAIHAKRRRHLRNLPAIRRLSDVLRGTAFMSSPMTKEAQDVRSTRGNRGNFARNINILAWMAGTSPAKTFSWRCVTPLALDGERRREAAAQG